MGFSSFMKMMDMDIMRDVLLGVFCVVLYMIGCLLHQCGVKNVWWFEHALTLTIFLYIGQILRQYSLNMKLLYSGFLYIAIIVCMQLIGIRRPSITAVLNANVYDLPILLLLGVTGSMLILYVSKLVNKNAILEYLGRNSLVIYCLHISILGAVHNIGERFVGTEAVSTVWFSVLQLCLTVMLLLLFSWLLNKRYLRVLQGKF